VTTNDAHDDMVISYLILRRVVGILGVALPIILMLWGFALLGSLEIKSSLSEYYELDTRDAFVGILFALACFFFAYKGPEFIDDIAGDLACLFAFGVALFPIGGEYWQGVVHLACALALFLVLAFFSLFLFTKSGGQKTPRKKIRNRIYIACGVTMLVCIALIGIYNGFLKDTSVAAVKPVFWLESLALWAFGISWFIKGDTLVKDAGDLGCLRRAKESPPSDKTRSAISMSTCALISKHAYPGRRVCHANTKTDGRSNPRAPVAG
jgi:hypothetical protein